MMEENQIKGVGVEEQARPLAIYNPTTHIMVEVDQEDMTPMEEEDGVITTQEEEVQEDKERSEECYLVHTKGGGQRLVPKTKWPQLTLKGEDRSHQQYQTKVGRREDRD
jgi:hypothetical protein